MWNTYIVHKSTNEKSLYDVVYFSYFFLYKSIKMLIKCLFMCICSLINCQLCSVLEIAGHLVYYWNFVLDRLRSCNRSNCYFVLVTFFLLWWFVTSHRISVYSVTHSIVSSLLTRTLQNTYFIESEISVERPCLINSFVMRRFGWKIWTICFPTTSTHA